MPFEPLRFVHAANVFLDRPLGPSTAIPPNVREIVESATLTAFHNVVDVCVERDVDFLLLGGNTFVESDRSLPARVALRQGLKRLQQAGIDVYVLPGLADPADAWRAIPHLPANVTLFCENDGEPVAVFRDKKVVASIGPVADRTATREDAADSSGPFRIGLCPIDESGRRSRDPFAGCYAEHGEAPSADEHARATALKAELERSRVDYLALAGNVDQTLLQIGSRLIHHPGAPQGRSLRNAETGTCTLVEVDERRAVKCTPLPVAAVRFQSLTIHAGAEWNEDRLLQAVRSALLGRSTQPCEQMVVVDWRISGRGALVASLADRAARSRLVRSFPGALADGRTHLVHTLSLDEPADRTATSADDRLANDVDAALMQAAESASSNVQDWAAGLAASLPQWADRVGSIAGRLDAGELLAAARRQIPRVTSGDAEVEPAPRHRKL